jgi:hypothetical protein
MMSPAGQQLGRITMKGLHLGNHVLERQLDVDANDVARGWSPSVADLFTGRFH